MRCDRDLAEALLFAALLPLVVAGCGQQRSSADAVTGKPAAQLISRTGSSRYHPGIHLPAPSDALGLSGTPRGTVLSGSLYSFLPMTTRSNTRPIRYAIRNKPSWASFDVSTGLLSGYPSSADVGSYTGIIISATDGLRTVTLPGFDITVAQAASGAVTVSWLPPMTNTDGSALSNLAGYRISYGMSAANLAQTIDVSGPGFTSYVVDNLTPGTWYFAVEAYNSDGTMSQQSAIVAVNVADPQDGIRSYLRHE